MIVGFKSEKIVQSYNTVGDELMNARIKQGKDLKKVSRKINVDIKYLEALENNDYCKLPDGLYSKKILRKYVDFLNLDFDIINNILLQEEDVVKKEKYKKTDLFLTKTIKWKNFIVFSKFSKTFIIVLLTLICFSYLWFTLQHVFSPPDLVILNPVQNSLITNKKNIVIKGITDPGTKVKINGRLVLKNRDGEFSKNIYLKNGINNIIIIASKKYSKENIVKKQILVNN